MVVLNKSRTMESTRLDGNPWKSYAGKGKEGHERKRAREIAIAGGEAA